MTAKKSIPYGFLETFRRREEKTFISSGQSTNVILVNSVFIFNQHFL